MYCPVSRKSRNACSVSASSASCAFCASTTSPAARAEVRIWFTQHPEPAFSKIQVFGPDGKEVDKKDSHVDEKEKSVLIVSVEQLPPGTYKVHWDVVSLDTHRTRGDFKFTVK